MHSSIDATRDLSAAIGSDYLALSGDRILKQILDAKNPEELVRKLSSDDFYWIVKKIGDEESLALLEIATEEQWQYLVDLDVWDKDILSPVKSLAWFRLLADAAPERLSAWLLGEEQELLSLLLFRTAEVIIKDEGDDALPPANWFTLDGRFYVKALDAEEQDNVEALLSMLGKNDHELYQELLFDLAAISPTEAEEELYRQRNVRIAEHGFLPFEEAIAVYAPLDLSALDAKRAPLLPGRLLYEEETTLVPALPRLQLQKESLLAQTFSAISDPALFDRLSLEFADLANRLIIAGRYAEISSPEIFTASCRQAGGYLNIIIERMCGRDKNCAESLLRNHSLLTLFRTGYGLAARLHRDTKRWISESWFFTKGLKNAFWGTPWGDALDGLLMERPRFFIGPMNAEPFKEFANIQELDFAEKQLRMIQSLDRLLARLSPADMDAHIRPSGENTVHSMILTRWAHKILKEEPSFAHLARADAARFFYTVRDKEHHVPYRMASYREIFIADFMEGAPDFEPEASASLTGALEMIWEDFTGEYENIAAKDLEGRYSPFLRIVT